MSDIDLIAEKQRKEMAANVEKWPRHSGKAELLRSLNGEKLTRAEAIKAMCYYCCGGEPIATCSVAVCPLAPFSQWNKTGA